MKTFYLTAVNMAMIQKTSSARFFRKEDEYLIRRDDGDRTYFHRFNKSGISNARPCRIRLRNA